MHLHGLKILHRDVACRNILIKHDWTPKLSDFGLSVRFQGSYHSAEHGDKIPVGWCAPEIFIGSPRFTTQSDVYSAGVTLWEILNKGDTPYKSKHPKLDWKAIQKKIIDGKLSLEIPENTDEKYATLVKACLSDASKRPSAYDVLCKYVSDGLKCLQENGSAEMLRSHAAKEYEKKWAAKLQGFEFG